MKCFLDRTFCASKDCQNKCGRKMTVEEAELLYRVSKEDTLPVSYAYFCGENHGRKNEQETQ